MSGKLSRLESLRGLAAMYVFAGHLFTQRILEKTSPEGFIFRFGQEAVMVFFLISGFVIYLSIAQSKREISFLEYFSKRWRRIYPIYLVALALSVLTSSPDEPTLNLPTLLGNLAMLQDFAYGKPGVWFSPLGGNSAIWSLSYEWWFYMLFYPLVRWVPARFQLNAAGTVSVLGFLSYTAHPNQISLILMNFILWWSGAELARQYLQQKFISFRSSAKVFGWLGGMALLQFLSVAQAIQSHTPLSLGMHPILELRSTLDCAALIGLGILWKKFNWALFDKTIGPFARVAPISYGIYVLHWPLAIAPTYLDDWGNMWSQAAVYTAVTMVCAWIAEIPFQRWINKQILSIGSANGGMPSRQ